jgi:hypothetical protein
MPETCSVSWQNKILDTWCILLLIYTKIITMHGHLNDTLFSEVSNPVNIRWSFAWRRHLYLCRAKVSTVRNFTNTAAWTFTVFCLVFTFTLVLEWWTKTYGKRVSISGPPTRRSLQLKNTQIQKKKDDFRHLTFDSWSWDHRALPKRRAQITPATQRNGPAERIPQFCKDSFSRGILG